MAVVRWSSGDRKVSLPGSRYRVAEVLVVLRKSGGGINRWNPKWRRRYLSFETNVTA